MTVSTMHYLTQEAARALRKYRCAQLGLELTRRRTSANDIRWEVKFR
ncbi:hypothetical protein [Umezawaea sp. NPDC059074]